MLGTLAGRDVVTSVRQEFAKLAPALAQVIREEITEASDEQVEAVFRRVFGSLDDQAPAGTPPV